MGCCSAADLQRHENAAPNSCIRHGSGPFVDRRQNDYRDTTTARVHLYTRWAAPLTLPQTLYPYFSEKLIKNRLQHSCTRINSKFPHTQTALINFNTTFLFDHITSLLSRLKRKTPGRGAVDTLWLSTPAAGNSTTTNGQQHILT